MNDTCEIKNFIVTELRRIVPEGFRKQDEGKVCVTTRYLKHELTQEAARQNVNIHDYGSYVQANITKIVEAYHRNRRQSTNLPKQYVDEVTRVCHNLYCVRISQ